MRIRWHGQSAYTLSGASHTVAIDPFGDLGTLFRGRRRFEYPPVPSHAADVLLVTHEHADHNGVEAITGSPHVVRSTAGRFETPVGEVVAVNSEHDAQAGTQRGPNTIFVFTRGRADDRGGGGCRHHGHAGSSLGCADALPHRGDRLPRSRRRVSGDVRAGDAHRV